MNIQTIVIIAVIAIALIGAAVHIYLYLRDKSLEEIRADVYQAFLEAEHTYLETGSGQQKMKFVIHKARDLLPNWAQVFISEDLLYRVVQMWFDAVKDLLDDGKYNRSVEDLEE